MTWIQAVVLGVLQGATEFLPVSSSGHLVIARELFGIEGIPVLYDVILHVATLLAVVLVLRRQVGRFLVAIARWVRRSTTDDDAPYLRLVPIIVATTAITGVIGIGLDSVWDIRQATLTSALFLVTAAFLIASRWSRGTRPFEAINWIDALVLGIAQGFGVLPGISRSGITISAALFRRLDRRTAGEYSFLLSIPAILGALALTIRDLGTLNAGIGTGPIIVGAVSAGVVGWVCLVALLRIVRSGKLYLFALYLIPLGIWGLSFFSR